MYAVTIALAVGVALWFSGIIGGAGKTEQLQVMPDSYINVTSGTSPSATLALHVRNVGQIDSKIISIKIGNVNAGGTFTISPTGGGTTSTTTAYPIVVKIGEDKWVIVSVGGITAPGTYQVTVYTDAGNSYNQQVTAYQT